MNLLLIIHHYLAFLTLTLIIITFFYIIYFKTLNLKFPLFVKILSLLMIISLHIQAILGFILTINIFNFLLKNNILLINILRNPNIRYKIIEHPLMMIVSVILGTLIHLKLKKNEINLKIIFLFILTLIILFSRIPFNQLFI